MTKFNIYTDDHIFDVTIEATSPAEALDSAAQIRGAYIDHTDMCWSLGLTESDLNIVEA